MVINAQQFLEAIEAIELSKGISREVVLTSLEEAMKKGYKKELGGDDAVVEVIIKPEQGIIEMYNIKDIVDEVEDDFLQISLEDAKDLQKAGKGKIEGDKFYIPAEIETLRKATANSIKSILKQKFAEAEKSVLYETFKDKINTMITGRVEKVDERGCSVNIGRTSVFLPRNQMIGDEKFNSGDEIRLFVEDVASGTKGAHIIVSRASEGFLKALFYEEIREIYDGTIIIKGVAREAGERSKVSVFTTDPNVDPAGACIGQNGNRIQKIVSQLGNGQSKEKIDIIAYSDNPSLYVMESLKPARVVGLKMSDEEKAATVVVKDDSLSLAIGRKGVNARLAVRLTGYKIDIKTETDALNEGFEFQSLEEIQAIELEKAEKLAAEKAVATHTGEVLPGLPEGYVAPQQRVYADEEDNTDLDEALREKAEEEEFVPAAKPVVEEAPVTEETPVAEEAPAHEEIKEVKTTTTLEDLEKTLESSAIKGSGKKSSSKKTSKKKADGEEEEKVTSPKQDPSTFMSIYTEEELREMDEEEQEEEFEDEDVDYDEYDEYYDDDEK